MPRCVGKHSHCLWYGGSGIVMERAFDQLYTVRLSIAGAAAHYNMSSA